jgi:uncharacterized repeat protein (TIGR01451 family)
MALAARPLEALEVRSLLSQVFPVTNTSDNTSVGSLRWAIGQVNADATDTLASPDEIHFTIPEADPGFNAATGVWTIAPATALPTIDAPCIVDGYSQLGSAANTSAAADHAVSKIELDGGPDATLSSGLTFGTGAGSDSGVVSGVRGLAIHSFQSDVELAGSGIFVQGDFLGTNAAGAAPLGRPTRAGTGITIDADTAGNVIGIASPGGTGNTMGGTADFGQRNLISNNNVGIQTNVAPIDDETSDNNLIAGNLIGTDPTGTLAVGNEVGISFGDGSDNTVGGTTPAQRNVISGNNGSGMRLIGVDFRFNVIEGNYIGTDVTGTRPLGNGNDGIQVDGGSDNTIGGTVAAAANVISANGGTSQLPTGGIFFPSDESFVREYLIEGNLIGTDATGTQPLGNVGNGIRIAQSTDNALLGNIIAFNSAIGIDLVGGVQNSFGVTANSPGGPHDGPNNLQNYPVLTSAVVGAGGTVITGTLNSDPSSSFRIDFYAVPTPDPSGHGQALTYLGTEVVTTDASGNTTTPFHFTFPGDLSGQQVTALATFLIPQSEGEPPAPGSTSEFSADIPVGAAAQSADMAVINPSANPNPVPPDGEITYTFTITDLGPDVAQGVAASVQVPAGTTFVSLAQSSPFFQFQPPPVGGGSGTTIVLTAPSAPVILPVTLTLVVRVDPGTPLGTEISDTAIVAAATSDPRPANNRVTASTVVGSPFSFGTTTSLLSQVNPTTVGQAATFEATVASNVLPISPTGTVTFSVDGAAVATLPFTSEVAEGPSFVFFTTSTLSVGSHTVTAHYNPGGSSFLPSDSQAVQQVVNQASTTTTLTPSANPSAAGQPVLFSAVIAPVVPQDGPTGTVVFLVDGIPAATAPVGPLPDGGPDVGLATFLTSSLTPGSHTIVAQYSGDASFAPSQSQAVVETITPPVVNPAPSVVEVLRYGFHAAPTALAVVFDRPLFGATAAATDNYVLVGPHRQVIPILKASLAPGGEVVVLQPSRRLNVHWTYTLTIIGTPPYGVASSAGTFIGSDPVETITLHNLVWRRTPAGGSLTASRVRPQAHAVDALLAAEYRAQVRASVALRHRR